MSVLATILLATVLAATVTACSGGSGDGSRELAASPTPATTTTPPPSGKPGGTLRIVTQWMPSGDPGWADQPGERAVSRLVTRQLYSYPSDEDTTKSTIPRPDLAVGAPVVTENGLVYTVRLRPAARWDTPNQRRITANDVARGIKRLCTPPNPSPLRGYFTATIVGFREFCAQLAATPVADAAAFVESSTVEGIEIVGDDTLAFHLLAPVNDFVDVLALPAASPVPLEALAYPPDSLEYLHNLVSAGPYRFTVAPGEGYRLSRSPSWSASSDGIRRALPDHITIFDGLSPEAMQQELESGDADMSLDGKIPDSRAVELARANDPRLVVDGVGVTLALTVGFNGPSAAALRELSVRRALPYCIDRVSLAAALGGPEFAAAATGLLQETMTGYTDADPFPSPAGLGDAARCREALSHTPGGPVTALSLLTTDSATDVAAAEALRTAFARSGIRLDIRIRTGERYRAAAVHPTGQFWDLALTTIAPDWYGDAGRTVFQPLLDETWAGPRPADGGYRDPGALHLLATALRATSEATAASNWADLEHTLVEQVAVIPLAVVHTPQFHSTNVTAFTIVPSIGTADPTAVSLGSG
ncbi:ABC transporter substrate-binding protein [Frankia sp. CcI156]|uniref:Extracellular solute-binding protein, family 5 n=3 Tax=Frankia TaxID=1854 RepID=Q2JCH5_FRACC|nr:MULTISPECIES: ABC transporter substrate-binding protein [Frankia]ETA00650.1 ABC-type dipeptide transport system, periplasmic component [Frankia sp. CcI6]OHV57833.1 ABC transporter substrate-binding protein [Frankia sp. CgIS1]ABD11017.1 extracellular solute-binding protein, family 5 [Frankia casuarinae]EYT91358.1 ABC-type dipeptide transport system, periplasmic component [Frankia casuarinae]KDA41764.1 ABC-type dipeptide transport system, periplasmic component [Frankia sp. BMG5.23]